jgi:hypothetical protein
MVLMPPRLDARCIRFHDRSADYAMISTIFFPVIVTIAVLPGPNTRGKNLTAALEIITAARAAQELRRPRRTPCPSIRRSRRC